MERLHISIRIIRHVSGRRCGDHCVDRSHSTILHRERALIASSKLDHGILLSEDEINAFNRAATAAQVDNGEVAVARATIESYSHLSEDEKLLDSSLYNILDSCG